VFPEHNTRWEGGWLGPNFRPLGQKIPLTGSRESGHARALFDQNPPFFLKNMGCLRKLRYFPSKALIILSSRITLRSVELVKQDSFFDGARTVSGDIIKATGTMIFTRLVRRVPGGRGGALPKVGRKSDNIHNFGDGARATASSNVLMRFLGNRGYRHDL
jgi:hypothetical protein